MRTSSHCRTSFFFFFCQSDSSDKLHLKSEYVISPALHSQSSVDRYTFLIRLEALRLLGSFHLFNRCRHIFLVWQKPPCAETALSSPQAAPPTCVKISLILKAKIGQWTFSQVCKEAFSLWQKHFYFGHYMAKCCGLEKISVWVWNAASDWFSACIHSSQKSQTS